MLWLLTVCLLMPVTPLLSPDSAIAATTTPTQMSQGDFIQPVTKFAEVPEDFIGIYTAEDLDGIRYDLDGKYILMNDLVFSEADFSYGGKYYFSGNCWVPIGDQAEPFTGVFNGNGYCINGLVSNRLLNDVGLFGVVDNGAQIANLGMNSTDIDFNLDGIGQSGGIAGTLNHGSTIRNCYVDGTINGDYGIGVGGIVGLIDNGSGVSFSYNSSDIICYHDAGGVVGTIGANSTVKDCFNNGLVTSRASKLSNDLLTNKYAAGGIAASLGWGSSISECYSAGTVTCERTSSSVGSGEAIYAGGITGISEGSISDCFSTARLHLGTATYGYCGGIVGMGTSGTKILNSYFAGNQRFAIVETSPNSGIAGLILNGTVENCYRLADKGGNTFGTYLTESQMSDKLSFQGFDFASVWSQDRTKPYVAPYLKSLGQPLFSNNTVDFAGGDGTVFNPFKISTLAQLKKVSNYRDADFVLLNDIAGTTSTGGDTAMNSLCSSVYAFYGTFDGKGHTLTDFSYSSGLFVQVGYYATVKNLILVSCSVQNSPNNSGGITGTVLSNGLVQNCSFDGKVTGLIAGGIAGVVNAGGKILQCTNKATITAGLGTPYIGGIAGKSQGILEKCTNAGEVNSQKNVNAYVGGIAGYVTNEIMDCHNTGFVYGGLSETVNSINVRSFVGGVAGYSFSSIIQRCSNAGQVVSGRMPDAAEPVSGTYSGYTGGLVGYGSMALNQSYNTGQVYSFASNQTEDAYAGGLVGYLNGTMRIMDNYNTGHITAWGMNAYSGGLFGTVRDNAAIENAYNLGSIDATGTVSSNPGGIRGEVYKGMYINCYYLSETGDDGTYAGIPMTQSQLQNSHTLFFSGSSWTTDSKVILQVLSDNPPQTYDLSFALNGGTMPTDQPTGYVTGWKMHLPTPIRPGYAFAGWFDNTQLTGEVKEYNPETSIGTQSYFAKWIPNTYTVKFNANGGIGTMGNMTMTYGTATHLNANKYTRTGYAFLGWAKSATGSIVYKDSASAMNITTVDKGTANLYAKWGSPILTAAPYGYTSNKITWTTAGNATAYKIYESYEGGTYYLVHTASPSERSWVSTGLRTGKGYYYRVYPVVGTKLYSNSVYLYAKPVPAAPSIILSKYAAASIKVSWTGVAGATKYQIYRATSLTGTYSLVFTAPSTSTSWVNNGLTPGRIYYYKVRACHLEGTTYVYGSFSGIRYYSI